MKISMQFLKNYFVSTVIVAIFLVIIITSSDAALIISCEAGGPYSKNATINIIGNVTNNSVGAVANVSVNVSLGGTQKVSINTSSDPEGNYVVSALFTQDFNSYDVVASAQANGVTVYCNDNIAVQLSTNTSCQNRVLHIEGQALFSSDLSPVTGGRATVGIAEEKIANSSALNSTGGFSVPISLCFKKGSKYTFNVIVDDGKDKQGYLQQVFVAI